MYLFHVIFPQAGVEDAVRGEGRSRVAPGDHPYDRVLLIELYTRQTTTTLSRGIVSRGCTRGYVWA